MGILGDFCAVHVDESPWPIQGQDSQGYMWAISNRIGSCYQFEPTRSGLVAQELLKNHEGSVLTDGYGGYNRVKKADGMRLGRCWSHARREFFDRIKDYPNEVEQIVRMIDELFHIESKAANFEELKILRKTQSKEVVDRIYRWLVEPSGVKMHRHRFSLN